MSDAQIPAERHYRFRRRQFLIYLLGCTAMALGTLIAVLMPGEDDAGIVLIPTFGLFGLMILLELLERARSRDEYKRESGRIGSDEWVRSGMNRARSIAFATVIFGQVPLMFFMAYVPAEPSIVGMGAGTVSLGCLTWAAAFLYHTRATPDE